MKTYIICLSKAFPSSHPMKGKPTDFKMAMLSALLCAKCCIRKKGMCMGECVASAYIKRHTVRANYPLWAKRIAEVQRGEAVLSVRQWSGRPYMSKQKEIARLTKDDGIGIQKLRIKPFQQHLNSEVYLQPFIYDDTTSPVNMERLANNDGLSLEDWRQWFKDYDLTKPLAIIHFTSFRY